LLASPQIKLKILSLERRRPNYLAISLEMKEEKLMPCPPLIAYQRIAINLYT
jgi:hypothetical protein